MFLTTLKMGKSLRVCCFPGKKKIKCLRNRESVSPEKNKVFPGRASGADLSRPKNLIVGNPLTSYFPHVASCTVQSTAPNLTLPCSLEAARAHSGASALQCPHLARARGSANQWDACSIALTIADDS